MLLLSRDVIRYGALLLNNKSSALIFACFGRLPGQQAATFMASEVQS